jgi:hypothetical protein
VRRAARTDLNHGDVRDALRAAGWYVHDTSGAGDGMADMVVCGPGGVWVLVEVKSKRGKLTPAQKALREQADAAGAPYVVARSPEEAVAGVLGACREDGGHGQHRAVRCGEQASAAQERIEEAAGVLLG